MNKLSASVDVVNLMRDVTFHVTLKRATELKWRMWLGVHLLYLAAVVLNCNLEIDGITGK